MKTNQILAFYKILCIYEYKSAYFLRCRSPIRSKHKVYVVQAMKVLENLMHAETNAKSSKTGFPAVSFVATQCIV